MAEHLSPVTDETKRRESRITRTRERSAIQAGARTRGNDLSGSEWTRNSISIWSDIRKSPLEMRLQHPAMFPESLAARLIQSFTRSDEATILDPFMGSGATIAAAHRLGRLGIGLEIYEEFIEKTRARLAQSELNLGRELIPPKIVQADARKLAEFVDGPIDMCITSPPYWDILERKRTADYKQTRNYGTALDDLGKIPAYQSFLGELDRVWQGVHQVLKPGAYFCVIAMDLRKSDQFFPFHMDLTQHITQLCAPGSFFLDDIIVWNRQNEYNNLRCLGYPSTFRINKVHEFILIFRKPRKKA